MDRDQENKIVNRTREQEFAARAAELAALEERFGPGVGETVLAVRAREVEADWRGIAFRSPRSDIQALQDTLWTWCAEAGFRHTAAREGHVVQMKVTFCPLAEMARTLGRADWGYRCYCADDEAIVRGFNPAIRFSRTKTLMQGHDCCDHRYEE